MRKKLQYLSLKEMASLVLTRLTTRKLLKIYGPDCYPYLQGLVSNDLRHLYEPDRILPTKHAIGSQQSLSAFMLNAQGRAICDMIIYRTPLTRPECQFSPPGELSEPDELIIECDTKLASGLANTLYGYRVRRKISLVMMDGKLSLWCLFPKFDPIRSELFLSQSENLPLETLKKTNEVMSFGLSIVNDPRLTSMGLRIISESASFDEVKSSIQSSINADIEEGTIKDYISHRYALGVGEGLDDHPESNCLPLECNGDLLNSISFTKGCYLGQELTARIHYTGVVRKRLMPIVLDLSNQDKSHGSVPLINGMDIIDKVSKKKVGIFRHRIGNHGLALLRHDLLSGPHELVQESTSTKLSTYRPYWWDTLKK